MDAKVLRSAVSAAIRATVSSALIGCGGNVTADAGHGAPSPGTSGSATRVDEAVSASQGAGGQAEPYPKIESTGGGGGAATLPVTGSGGSEVGGMASSTGAAGEPASAGAPPEICGAAAEACMTSLEQTPRAMPPSDADKACCDTLLQELARLEGAQAECYRNVAERFMRSDARPKCCSDPSTWQQTACAPWGPPVPPELAAENWQGGGWA